MVAYTTDNAQIKCKIYSHLKQHCVCPYSLRKLSNTYQMISYRKRTYCKYLATFFSFPDLLHYLKLVIDHFMFSLPSSTSGIGLADIWQLNTSRAVATLKNLYRTSNISTSDGVCTAANGSLAAKLPVHMSMNGFSAPHILSNKSSIQTERVCIILSINISQERAANVLRSYLFRRTRAFLLDRLMQQR